MKILKLMVLIIIISFLSISCEESGGGGSEATSLGTTLNLSGEITHVFVPPTVPSTATYSHKSPTNYYLVDEETDVEYDIDATDDGDFDLTQGAITDSDALISFSDIGLSSSNTDAEVATVKVRKDSATGDEIAYGSFNSAPVEWYWYIYATADTTVDGQFTDGGDTNIFDKVSIFTGWNRLIKSTSDGTTYNYYGGTISDGHWTHFND